MNKYLSLDECYDIATDVCKKLHVAEFASKIRFKFKNMICQMGNARGDGLITLSKGLFERATEQERYETIVHEICHILALWIVSFGANDRYKRTDPLACDVSRKAYLWLYGDWNPKYPIKAHGLEWKTLMKKLGVEPKRCHTVDPKGMPNTKQAKCNCSTYTITSRKAKQIKYYTCKKCNSGLKLV